MSSTGLTYFNANYINSDIIDVNEKLTVNNIDILELLNNNFYDLSENIQGLSENLINKINDLSQNMINDIDHRWQPVQARPTGIWLSRSFRETACHTIL